jgi:hypothetical protein
MIQNGSHTIVQKRDDKLKKESENVTLAVTGVWYTPVVR